jgi:hypothetical protein
VARNSGDAPDVGNTVSVATPSPGASVRSEMDAGRRRFTYASLIAVGLTGIPYVWISWVLWGPFNPLRLTVYEDNFYDLQARAMFHGHLSLQTGSLGIEGFVHDGRTYTYFGLFPSIIRMPILLFTSSLDGKLTAPYMLAAWLLTGLFASMLLWRVRFLVRGNVAMGRAEAAAFGVLLATIMGGTVWMLLAANPYVFNEDIAWSICLTTGSIFALLGVIERPSRGRVIASGVLILCANLDRATTGWACAVGAGFIAVWLLFGFGGPENRRWFLPVLAAGLIPLIVGCVVNYSKFGVLFGVSNQDQVWTHVNAYRRKFLAANHDAEEGLIFVPTNVLTYFRPDGLNISSVFPFVTLPSVPPTPVGGVLFDRLYRTASLPASTPLLFLLSVWGCVTAFRPKAVGRVARTRLLLLAAGSAGAALMLWGYISPRYIGDFVPFLAIASAVAMADIFRRLVGRRRSVQVGAIGIITVASLFSILANVGMAVVPNEEMNTAQILSYVQTQKTVSDFTGHPLEGNVVRRTALPAWGPAGQIDVNGNCNAMYISNGEKYWTVPTQQFTRTTWMAVEWGGSFLRTFHVATRSHGRVGTESIPLLTAGNYRVIAHLTAEVGDQMELMFTVNEGGKVVRGETSGVRSGTTQTVAVVTDPLKHLIEVNLNGVDVTSTNPTHTMEPIHVGSDPAQAGAVTEVPSAVPTLCESLIH